MSKKTSKLVEDVLDNSIGLTKEMKDMSAELTKKVGNGYFDKRSSSRVAVFGQRVRAMESALKYGIELQL